MILIIFLLNQTFNRSEFLLKKEEAFRSRNILTFIEYARDLKKRFPEESEIYFGLAEAYLRVENFSEAVKTLKTLLHPHPEEIILHRAISLLEQSGRLTEEVGVYNEFRRIKGKNHLFSFEVSHLYERLNDYRSATRELINKIRLDSLARRPPVLNSVIDRLVLLYKMDKDIIQLVQTAMIDKKVRSRILARLYLVDKRYDRALKEYLFLEDNLLLSEFGEICLKQGLDSLALVCYLRLGNKEEVARLYLKMGNYEQALKALEDSDDLRFQILRVECLIKMRRLDEALKIARSLLEHNTSLRLYLLTEDIYLQKRDFGEAQKVLNNAMKLIDRDSLAYIFFEKANLALFHFKIDEAVAGYNWLVEHFPTNLLANDALERLLVIRKAGGDTAALRMCCSIWYLIKIDSTRQAIDSARKFIKEKRWLAEEGYLMLINIYACRKEYDLGIGAVEEFEVNFPKSERMGRALIIKARILKELGEKDKARETLEYIIMKFGSAPEVLLSREMLNDLRQ